MTPRQDKENKSPGSSPFVIHDGMRAHSLVIFGATATAAPEAFPRYSVARGIPSREFLVVVGPARQK